MPSSTYSRSVSGEQNTCTSPEASTVEVEFVGAQLDDQARAPSRRTRTSGLRGNGIMTGARMIDERS
jgi:hypothetical protein